MRSHNFSSHKFCAYQENLAGKAIPRLKTSAKYNPFMWPSPHAKHTHTSIRDQVRLRAAPASIEEPTWTNSLINEGKTERARSPFLVRRNEAMRESDILALGGQSKIIGRCWDVLKGVTCLQSSLGASPHRPTQCSKTSLKMSDWKCEIPREPSNGQESYSGPWEQGYLCSRSGKGDWHKSILSLHSKCLVGEDIVLNLRGDVSGSFEC